MLVEEIADPDAVSPEEVRDEYEAAVAAVVADKGAENVVAETDADEEHVEQIAAGEFPELTVTEAASILALEDNWPDRETLILELRDHIMLQMSSAVLDVDALATGVDIDLDAKEIQQKIEGRQPMTLAEYAHIHHFIASENPF